jgi:hypothetical protein
VLAPSHRPKARLGWKSRLLLAVDAAISFQPACCNKKRHKLNAVIPAKAGIRFKRASEQNGFPLSRE